MKHRAFSFLSLGWLHTPLAAMRDGRCVSFSHFSSPTPSIVVTDPFRGRGQEGKGQRRPLSLELELLQDSLMLAELVDDSDLFGVGSLGATSCPSPLSPDFPALPSTWMFTVESQPYLQGSCWTGLKKIPGQLWLLRSIPGSGARKHFTSSADHHHGEGEGAFR